MCCHQPEVEQLAEAEVLPEVEVHLEDVQLEAEADHEVQISIKIHIIIKCSSLKLPKSDTTTHSVPLQQSSSLVTRHRGNNYIRYLNIYIIDTVTRAIGE